MLLKAPFYIQGKNECGPVSLQMVLEYLGTKKDKEYIKKLVNSESSGTTWTLGLAKTAAQLGFKVEFYSSIIGFNPKNYELEYYQKNTDGARNAETKINKLLEECRKFGFILEERSLTIQEILSKINENCLAIVCLDWSKIVNKDSYVGHFVPIIGYDEENVIVHNPGADNPKANLTIKKELFDIARKAKGTDEDIVFIYRK